VSASNLYLGYGAEKPYKLSDYGKNYFMLRNTIGG